MRDSLIKQRLKEQGFNDKYIDEFIRIYKASVIANIPNPLYYRLSELKNLTNRLLFISIINGD